jgi:hypothetical protein
MINLQDDCDNSHHPQADSKSFLTGQTGESAPDGTHPSNYAKGKKCNDMSASKSDGIIGVNY